MTLFLSGQQTRTNVTERYLKFIRRQKVKGLMGAASSSFAAQQISIQYRKVTWENISCVSERQGEKWQLAVYNSSTLLSLLILSPVFAGALGASQLLVALFGPLLGRWVRGHRRETSDSNVWRLTLANSPADASFRRQSLSLFAATVLGMLPLTGNRSSAKGRRQGLVKWNTTDARI